MTHVLCMMDKERLQTNTLQCHTYCFSAVTVVSRTPLYVSFIRTLCVLLPEWRSVKCDVMVPLKGYM